MLSRYIGKKEANMIKLIAIKEVLKIFRAFKWSGSQSLKIENGSTNVMGWLMNPNSAPRKLRKVILTIEEAKRKVY